MAEECRIGFAGTDARTMLSALVVSTAKSQTTSQPYRGSVIRGTPAMPFFADKLNWPIDFFSTEDTSVKSYAKTIIDCLDHKEIDYLWPMPEALLFNGLIDILEEAGFGDRIAGLTQESSFIEADKIKCKELCHRGGIPVADSWAEVDAKSYQEVAGICLQYIHRHGGAVLKYPYSAGGKGARVVLNTWEIREVYDTLMADYKKDYKRYFHNKKWPLLIESRMSGVEISFSILVDKYGHYQTLPTSMDYPERFPGPAGKDNPITGGMGSISPHPFESPELLDLVKKDIAQPLIQIMDQENLLRPCVLYPGCIVSFELKDGLLRPSAIRVCEVNIRPGEPEFQTVARRLQNLGPLIEAMFTGELNKVTPEIREDQVSLCLALVTGPGGPDGQKGYPWSVTKYEPVEIDYSYFDKKRLQIIPSGMGYDQDKGLYSDGTRVAYINANGTVKAKDTYGQVAERLRGKILNAFYSQRIRVIPRENPQGNRLDVREDIGSHFLEAERIISS